MATAARNPGLIVTAAGTGINLALGVLYTWSIFKEAIKDSIEQGGPGSFQWDLAALNDPYAVCCLVFACTMIVAGKVQDRHGPRLTAIIGGVLVGAGFIWISGTTAYWNWVFGFGGLVGMGIAFGYAAATPPALKWFPPNKTGRIAGIVVSGFGLASVYIAPLAQYLLTSRGFTETMLFFGLAFCGTVSLLALLLRNPPPGFTPPGFIERRFCTTEARQARALFADENLSPLEMIQTPAFWRIWLLYFIGAGAGLMVIGSVSGMAKSSLGANAFLAVAILAVGNASGRIVAGLLADKAGRCRTLAGVFGLQAAMMFAAVPIIGAAPANAFLLVALATVIGFNYGANLALFPTFAKDLWGMKHFGANYGILFTAWGVGGFVMSRASQVLRAGSASYSASFLLAGVLLLIGAGLIICLRDKKEEQRRALSSRPAALSSKL
ncbi:MAG: OFA family MFS transporter [Thermodesulfobacteriota bacterium]